MHERVTPTTRSSKRTRRAWQCLTATRSGPCTDGRSRAVIWAAPAGDPTINEPSTKLVTTPTRRSLIRLPLVLEVVKIRHRPVLASLRGPGLSPAAGRARGGHAVTEGTALGRVQGKGSRGARGRHPHVLRARPRPHRPQQGLQEARPQDPGLSRTRG